MPELPEVETIRRKLEPHLLGQTIQNIHIFSAKQFVGSIEHVKGKRITDLKRTGKVININLDGLILNIHLKMTGQLLYAPDRNRPRFKSVIPFAKSDTMPARTTRIIIDFFQGGALYFNDLRKFGWMKITTIPEGPTAPDVMSKAFTVTYLAGILSRSKKPIKTLLMDQEKIAGIGNIYANDALFLAGILPTKTASSITEKSVRHLYASIKKVIKQGLDDLGSTGGDEAFVLPDGTRGSHQFHFLTYDREGKPCPKCGGLILRLKHGGRSSYYCPNCQK